MKHNTAYELLESLPEPATPIYTVKQANLAHQYGTPYPVDGDLTTRRHPGLLLTGDRLTNVAKGTP